MSSAHSNGALTEPEIDKLATAYAEHVNDWDKACGLTPHGMKECAASAAVCLRDPHHFNHEMVLFNARAWLGRNGDESS